MVCGGIITVLAYVHVFFQMILHEWIEIITDMLTFKLSELLITMHACLRHQGAFEHNGENWEDFLTILVLVYCGHLGID